MVDFPTVAMADDISAYQMKISRQASNLLNDDFLSAFRKGYSTTGGTCRPLSFCKDLFAGNILTSVSDGSYVILAPNLLSNSGLKIEQYLKSHSQCKDLSILNIRQFGGLAREPVPARPSDGIAIWNVFNGGSRILIIRAENYQDDFSDQTVETLNGPNLPPPLTEDDLQVSQPGNPAGKPLEFRRWIPSLEGAYDLPAAGIRSLMLVVNPKTCRIYTTVNLLNNYDTPDHYPHNDGFNTVVNINGKIYILGVSLDKTVGLYELFLAQVGERLRGVAIIPIVKSNQRTQ
jgi:hypothetical protein